MQPINIYYVNSWASQDMWGKTKVYKKRGTPPKLKVRT